MRVERAASRNPSRVVPTASQLRLSPRPTTSLPCVTEKSPPTDVENPRCHDTHDSRSGHAERVRVTFDPSVLSYESLLEDWFFRLHDPTTKNRQGSDVGTQYRSAVSPQTSEQRAAAERVVARGNASGRWPRPVTTAVEPAATWYSAEAEHQDYLRRHPGGYTGHWLRA